MRVDLLPYLRCPVDRSALTLRDATGAGDEVLSGTLTSASGHEYPIVDGVPDLTLEHRTTAERNTVAAFGREWARYDDFDGYMGSPELFSAFCGLDREQVEGRRVLEVGCGGGRWLRVLSELGASEVVGLEYSTAVVQAARRTRMLPNVHVVRGSALDMPLAPNFDVVVSIGVIHHLADPVLGLSRFRWAAAADHRVAFWVYAREGNELYLSVIGPLRGLTSRLPDRGLALLSRPLACLLWLYMHTVNRVARVVGARLPLREYLAMLSHLRFRDIESVVYDQLAPQIAHYPTRLEVLDWIARANGSVDRLHHRTGNSWQCHCHFLSPDPHPAQTHTF